MLADSPYNVLNTFERADDAIDANAEIAEAILDAGLRALGFDPDASNGDPVWMHAATPADLDKARSTIRQMYRDWSQQGTQERTASLGPVLSAIKRAFSDMKDRSAVRVLIPGAGLGRLVFELCLEGYTVEGNEISYHQLLASNWVLNHTAMGKQHPLFPFALDFSNVIDRQSQFQKIMIPDVHPASELATGESQYAHPKSSISAPERMSMAAADFVVLYSDRDHRDAYDVVATVFFLDTAPNVIRYIETIRNCLEEGGIWINNGPLLWHFGERDSTVLSSKQHDQKDDRSDNTGIGEPGSVELSNEEILLLVESMGFDIEEHRIIDQGKGYIQNPASMLQNVYRTSYWLARKHIRTPRSIQRSDDIVGTGR